MSEVKIKITTKICSKCGVEKPISAFYKNKSRKQGVHSACIDCYKLKNRQKPFGRFWKTVDRKLLHDQGLQRCNKCGEIKSLFKFNADSSEKTGLRRICTNCISKSQRNRHNEISNYKILNKKNIKKKQKEYSKNPSKSKNLFSKILKIDNPFIDVYGFINVSCYFCGKAYKPSFSSIQSRIRYVSGIVNSEHNFYCSDNCKQKCPTYGFNPNKQIDPRSKLYIPKTEAQNARAATKTAAIKKAVCDKYGELRCEICGQVGEVELHHTLPVAQFGMDSVDPDSFLMLCHTCHVKLHGECK